MTFKQKLEEVLDREFKKRKSKERGAALILFAEAVRMAKEMEKKIRWEMKLNQPPEWNNESIKHREHPIGWNEANHPKKL